MKSNQGSNNSVYKHQTIHKSFKYIPHDITRARLGRVAPLGRPSSVYKSNIECSFFFSQNDGQMTLKVKVNDCHFQYQLRVSQDLCIFGTNLVILAEIHYK